MDLEKTKHRANNMQPLTRLYYLQRLIKRLKKNHERDNAHCIKTPCSKCKLPLGHIKDVDMCNKFYNAKKNIEHVQEQINNTITSQQKQI